MTIAPGFSGKKTIGTTANATPPGDDADHNRTGRRPWYRRMRYVALLVALAVVVAGLVALRVRDSDTASGVPDHAVRVRLQGVQGVKGSHLVGVVLPGATQADLRFPDAVGGFRVAVRDDAAFSRVVDITTRSPLLHPRPMAGPLADVSPGRYFLMLWRLPVLSAYSAWLPNRVPGERICLARFDVGNEKVTTVTVTGFPRYAKNPRQLEDVRLCLQ